MARSARHAALRLVALLLVVASASTAAAALSTPGRIRVFIGQPLKLPLPPGVGVMPVGPDFPGQLSRSGSYLTVVMGRPGTLEVDLRLWGHLPLRPLRVDAVPPLRLVPGGQAIGVLYARQGVVVEQLEPVRDREGRWRWPGREANLAPGDVVVAVDERPAGDPVDLQRAVQQAGQSRRALMLTVRRGGRLLRVWLRPVDQGCFVEDGKPARVCRDPRFAAGLRLRDPAAGVGTLTFFDPATGIYGALGHMVVARGRHALPLRDGHIVWATISSVSRGTAGRPGEKVGTFSREAPPSGTIERNTAVGIFGRLLEMPPPEGGFGGPLPVALAREVREGPVTMLTVLDGQRVEGFRAEIVHIRPPGVPESQRLLLRVIDPRLLARTAGIVQGMSGSPLIQDGRLVGAVTHVSVQDPSRVYGVLIEPMLERSGLWGDDAGSQPATGNNPPLESFRLPASGHARAPGASRRAA